MKNTKTYEINIDGLIGEIQVTDNEAGRYMCLFKKGKMGDFTKLYGTYGFMVWADDIARDKIDYFPIDAPEKGKLTIDVMRKAFSQIYTHQ